MARVLVVDDEEGFRSFMATALELAGHEVAEAADGLDALEKLGQRSFHVMVTDLRMPRMDGMSLLRKVVEEQPELEVLVVTAHGSVQSAVEAMRLGAFDFLMKPLESPDELRLLVDRAAERRGLRALRERTGGKEEPKLTWGAPTMKPLLDALRKVSRTDATVILVGESGTGKEVTARAIHSWSARSKGPFVAVNCAALSESLLESELFGHEKGAFTGATAQRRGRIELADGGTFFLDEVGELKPELQAKLLRVLQERRFERLGGSRTLETDVRWIAATNRDLREMMIEGSFREDLYHRLAVFPLRLPPLRERREDILPLAERLLARIGLELGLPKLEMDENFRKAIREATWPGNVRELANALERAAILVDGQRLGVELLQGGYATLTPQRVGEGIEEAPRTLEQIEREAIERALASNGGNRRKAAEQLGIGLRTLYDKLKRWGM